MWVTYDFSCAAIRLSRWITPARWMRNRNSIGGKSSLLLFPPQRIVWILFSLIFLLWLDFCESSSFAQRTKPRQYEFIIQIHRTQSDGVLSRDHNCDSPDNVNVISRVHNKLGDDDDDGGHDVVLAFDKSRFSIFALSFRLHDFARLASASQCFSYLNFRFGGFFLPMLIHHIIRSSYVPIKLHASWPLTAISLSTCIIRISKCRDRSKTKRIKEVFGEELVIETQRELFSHEVTQSITEPWAERKNVNRWRRNNESWQSSGFYDDVK